ncbi:DUF4179 domain-containing protein [Pseudoneobacillus sp. C159]
MTCQQADKLALYTDGLLTEQENIQITQHLESCETCQQEVAGLKDEEQFLRDTLQTPVLPDHFADTVLNQLEPYPTQVQIGSIKKRNRPLNRILVTAAGVILAVGLSATVNPAFAKWIGGLFTTDQVDEGLRMASEAGFSKRINQEVSDNGVTFKVEDIVADSSRIAISYQLLNEQQKLLPANIEFFNQDNRVTILDSNGKELDYSNMGWSSREDYGMVEFSIRDKKVPEKVSVHFELKNIKGKKGNWQLTVPVDLTESLKATTTVPLDFAKANHFDILIGMKEARFAPSSTEIDYETSYSKEELPKVKQQIEEQKKQFGIAADEDIANFGSDLQFHVENEQGKTIMYHNRFVKDKGHPTSFGFIQGSTGGDYGKIGHTFNNFSFVPEKNPGKLTFVVDGIFKTEPAQLALKFKPEDLRKEPVSFEFEGNFITIKEAKKKTKLGLKKSLMPIETESVFTIEMEGGRESGQASLPGVWVLVDDKGESYPLLKSSSIHDEKDKQGRFITNDTLMTYDLKEVPEEVTLHLISATRYYELAEKWKVPLY